MPVCSILHPDGTLEQHECPHGYPCDDVATQIEVDGGTMEVHLCITDDLDITDLLEEDYTELPIEDLGIDDALLEIFPDLPNMNVPRGRRQHHPQGNNRDWEFEIPEGWEIPESWEHPEWPGSPEWSEEVVTDPWPQDICPLVRNIISRMCGFHLERFPFSSYLRLTLKVQKLCVFCDMHE